jgi:hypothetical protein
VAKPTAKKAEGIQFSFVAVRTVAGRPEALALDESSDPALDLFAKLKASRGCDENGRQLYTHAVLFLRSKSNRRLKFE